MVLTLRLDHQQEQACHMPVLLAYLFEENSSSQHQACAYKTRYPSTMNLPIFLRITVQKYITNDTKHCTPPQSERPEQVP